MIVSFIYNLEVVSNWDHLTVFFYYLNMAKKNKWPVISHERYFECFSNLSQSDLKSRHTQLFEYDEPCINDLNLINKYPILQSFENSIVSEFISRIDAWTYLLSNSYQPLEEYISNLFQQIMFDYSEDIEAILCFYEPKALRDAANKYGIPVIHQEMSMFRPPCYIKSGYFDFSEAYGFGELEKRYKNFMVEISNQSQIMLTRKEILALMMLPEYVEYLPLMDEEPLYEIGVGINNITVGMFYQYSLVNSEEIMLDTEGRYKSILTRGRFETMGGADNSATAFHFIIKCRRIAAVRSNLIFEAMLLGKTACVYGASPFAFMGTKTAKDISEFIAPLEFINFTVFSYFVPWKLMTDIEYIRWRLQNPSEIEIYNKHLDYYLMERNITNTIVRNENKRLENILISLGYSEDIINRIRTGKIPDLEKCIKKTECEKQREEYDKKYFKLAIEYEKLTTKYQELEADLHNVGTEYEKIVSIYNALNKEHRKLIENYRQLTESHT